MKRCIALILTLLMLCGCGSTAPATSPSDAIPTLPQHSTTAPTEPTEATTPTQDDAAVLAGLREDFPVIDGSTSLIPLEAGIRAAIFDKTIEEATLDVAHTSTWGSFYNLVEGGVDMIFSCPLSGEQTDYAAQQGVMLETIPVAMEGFVFVVNAENPIDTLTQQQIKDIYSGKITNWAQLGGLDEEIIAYQRNRESGSQNYMIEFMAGTPLMDAPTELRPASMSGLMDVIAVNDNARGAIGYSVYAYAADMYGNGNEIKFIRVDGVLPCKATFADGSYPLLGKNYAVFNANEPVDSPVRHLVDWILTDRGQLAIAKAGYVTVRDIGYSYTEETLEKYDATGTGPAAGALPTYEYRLNSVEHFENWDNLRDYLILKPVTLDAGVLAYHIDCLVDKDLQAEINDFIDEQFIWAEDEYPAMVRLVDSLNGDAEYGLYSLVPMWPLSSGWREGQTAACYASCTNGYLSVVVALSYNYQVMSGETHYYHAESATWDLLTGKRLDPEDLFCRGVDVDAILNRYITQASQKPVDEFTGYPEMTQDFTGLTTDGWCITPEAIYFGNNTPWFCHGIRFELDDLPDGTLVTEQPREFRHCFESPDVIQIKRFRTSDRDFYYEYNADGLVQCGFLKEEAHPNAQKINDLVQAHLDTYYTEEAIRGYYDSIGLDGNGIDLYMMDWYLTNLGGKYLVFQGFPPEYYIEPEDRFEVYPIQGCLIFELETGLEITWTDMLLPGWENLECQDISGQPCLPDYSVLDFQWMHVLENGSLYICLKNAEGRYYYLEIPEAYIRF